MTPETNRSSLRALFHLFLVWLSLGLQSFGGGTATLALVRRAAIDQYRWATEAEFARDWSLVQLAPGTNLLALTILLGRRAAGVWGAVLALAGLLLPSAVVTLLLTACYQHVQQTPLVRDALRGIIPATVGLGLVTAWQIARPPLLQSRRAGWDSFGVSVTLLLASVGAAQWGRLPVLVILLGAGGASAVWGWGRHQAQKVNR